MLIYISLSINLNISLQISSINITHKIWYCSSALRGLVVGTEGRPTDYCYQAAQF